MRLRRVMKKNNLIYRPKGPAIIKLDAKTGFPLEIHFHQNLNDSSLESSLEILSIAP